ncbi:MAG: PocR ligand-binding domain-containing protein [Nitrospirae bacterium]|jgi:ligand-binding sensor protein|nr:PocR ligand-binding domain-containing protein [Nitrospirota bacterium]
MELTDIMPVEGWNRLAEDIYTHFGFNGAVYDRNNNVIVKSEGWANKICPLIKGGDSRIICASAQQSCSTEAKETKETVIVECDAGLIKFIVPIFVNNEFVGSIGGCGCLLENSEMDTFYLSKLLKKDDIKDFLKSIERISQEKLTEAVKYVQLHIQDALKNKGILVRR